MHVTIKTVEEKSGAHILTSQIEGDGAVELFKVDDNLTAQVVSVSRTASGGAILVVSMGANQPQHVEEIDVS